MIGKPAEARNQGWFQRQRKFHNAVYPDSVSLHTDKVQSAKVGRIGPFSGEGFFIFSVFREVGRKLHDLTFRVLGDDFDRLRLAPGKRELGLTKKDAYRGTELRTEGEVSLRDRLRQRTSSGSSRFLLPLKE